MLFNSFSFFFFLGIVWCGFRLLNRHSILTIRNLWLLIACFVFYASYQLDFCAWLLYIIIVNYFGGFWIIQGGNRKEKTGLLITLTLLPLFAYKYLFFFLSNSLQLLGYGTGPLSRMQCWVLPVGLSFFTFQALTYTIDICRNKITIERSFVDFALSVGFFPTLIAGPITRNRELLPQIKSIRNIDLALFFSGGQQFTWGLFKKVVVADRLAVYVDAIYDSPSSYSGSTIAFAILCYSLQIYCDFSGYSDMAIGVARILGFDLKENFVFPYFATGIRDFWKRWHISLTGWFTEYLYISCGGNRVPKWRWVCNIMLVFLVSGFWHGAAWTFIVWGGLHGFFYLLEKFLSQGRKVATPHFVSSFIGGGITFLFVTIAWVFFRSPTIPISLQIFSRIIAWKGGAFFIGDSSFSFLLMLFFVLLAFLVDVFLYCHKFSFVSKNSLSIQNLGFMCFLLIAVELCAVPSTNFVYFLF